MTGCSRWPTSTGDLITSFGSGGSVGLPSGSVRSITFLTDSLYIVVDLGFSHKLFKVKPTDGTTTLVTDLSGFPAGFINDDVGGLTNDGSNLVSVLRTFGDLSFFSTAGVRDLTRFIEGSFGGFDALAFRSAGSQFFAGNRSDIKQLVAINGNMKVIEPLTPTLTGDIKGMVFDAADTLFIAHESSGGGKVVKASIPSDTTKKPLALAYDSDLDELYILVQGKRHPQKVCKQSGGVPSV